MRQSHILISTIALIIATPALADDEVVYAPPPEWVDEAQVPADDISPGKAIRLFESQVRIEDGTVWVYTDRAFKVDTPDALTRMGTLKAQWLPDKGNMVVHRVDLIRDGERIDVLGKGTKFEVLRREAGLERRIISGQLTATMAVPDLRVGDTLRFAFSTSVDDQALGEEAEYSAYLMRDPVPLVQGRVTAEWPADQGYAYKVRGVDAADKVKRVGDTNRFELTLPVPEPEDMPYDAPSRYNMPAMVQVSSFDSWNEISKVMAPHFATDGTIAGDSPIAAEVKRITGLSDNPLHRAALATQVVQDEIAYLMDGLDGGNYLPQMPGETWEKRYGDCKAKSVLLLAMLREMGIESEAVLVRTRGGDAIPEMLPVPGNFNHMIVKADIGGETYWLDGTSAGTRVGNIAEVPPFAYALPLRAEGAELVPMDKRTGAVPEQQIKITIDQRAGIDVPALFEFEAKIAGPLVAQLQSLESMAEGEQRDKAMRGLVQSFAGAGMAYDYKLTVDQDAGIGAITAKGLLNNGWEMDKKQPTITVPYQPAETFSINGRRAKSEWRDIPVRVRDSGTRAAYVTFLLPDNGEGFSLRGSPDFEELIGGTKLQSSGALEGGKFTLAQQMHGTLWELPASELPQAKRDALRLKRKLPRLDAPQDARRSWQYGGKDRAMLDGIEQAYSSIFSITEEDEKPRVHSNRSRFRYRTGDWAGAKSDMDAMIADSPNSSTYSRRARTKEQLGDVEGALDDLNKAEEIDQNGSTTYSRITLLGLLDRSEEGLELATDYALIAEDIDESDSYIAYAQGWAGNTQEGLTAMVDLSANAGAQSKMHNQLCWYAGIWNVATEDTIEPCRKAVEHSGSSLAGLDSRALVFHRLGRNEEAIADLDHVLQSDPGKHASRYLRGIVRVANGDKGGRQDIEDALEASPRLKTLYAAWGLGG